MGFAGYYFCVHNHCIPESVVTMKAGFAIEKRDKNDASLSVGPVRVRLPQWAFWLGFLGIIVGGWVYVSKISIEHGGTYVRIKGVTDSRGRHVTNVYQRVEAPIKQ